MPDIQSSCGAVHSADSLIGQAGCGASRSAFLLFGMACDIILEVLDWEGIVRFFRHLVYIDQRFRLHRRFGILGEPSPCPHRILCTENEYPWAEAKKKRSLISQASPCGGDSWTRTNDPIDVNDVLYRLSHATTLRFEVPTKVSYRLSHATICGNRWHYIMRRGFGQGKFPRTASVVCRVAAGMGTAMVPAEEQ